LPTTRRLAPSFLPATAVLEMTYRCNHACLFCSCPWLDPDNDFDLRPELPVEAWKQAVSRLGEMGCTIFAFTGGEALLKPGLLELIEHTAGLEVEHVETEEGELRTRLGPPKLYLLSNGKLMSDEVLRFCARHDVHLSLSLPGMTTFGEHTQGSTTTADILGWFRRAADLGVETTAGVTVTALNIDELYETLAEALLAGAGDILLNRFLPGGRGLQHADRLSLPAEDIPRMLDIAEDVLQTAKRWGNVGTELPKCLFDPSRYERLTVGTRCAAARDFFVIDPSGYIRVCNHSPVRLVHLDDIETLPDHPEWQRFVFKDYLPAACAGCPISLDCDGGCREAARVVTGQPNGVDPALAKKAPNKAYLRPALG
jgi:radical SAM protein with 4Fe4S-binding SPASM domain